MNIFKKILRKITLSILRYLIKKNSLYFHKAVNFVNVIQSDTQEYLRNIKKITNTELIIDVGVHEGTPDLYKVFNDNFFALVDPIDNLLKDKPKNYKFFKCGLGKENKEMDFFVHAQSGQSSFKKEIKIGRNIETESIKSIKINVLTLDHLISNELKNFNKIGIKIDTQGTEFEILEGLNKELDKVEFILLENNILQRYHNSKLFSEITALLLKKGFYFFNIINPTSAIPRYAYDCVFLKKTNEIFTTKIT